MQIQEALTAVDHVLQKGRQVLQSCWTHLRQNCLENGKVSATRLDNHQWISYELSLSTAEWTAAEFLRDYSRRLREQEKPAGTAMMIEEQLTLTFCMEVLQNLRSWLMRHKSECGLSTENANRLWSPEVESLCSSFLTSKKLTELGQRLLPLDGRIANPMLDEEKEIMAVNFRRFAEKIVAPRAEAIHRQNLIIPDEILAPITELGCFGLSIPIRYGGIQADDQEDNLGMIVVTEELSRASLGAAGSLITRPEIMAKALLKGGSATQKQSWLPKLAAGDPLCAIAITEPDFGSDVASLRMKATRTRGGWCLQGEKMWCTFAGKAGVLLTLARTHPDKNLGHKGLSLFIVEKPGSEGSSFKHIQQGGGSVSGSAIATLGYRGMHSFNVFFDNYFVPDDALLGEEEGEGNGFYYTMAGFTGGRVQTASRANGLMQAAYEQSVAYAKKRLVFGKPLASYQLTLVKLVKMACLMTASRQFTYTVGRLMDLEAGQMEASMVKLFACKASEWVCREAMQIHGGIGYAEESAVSRYFVDSRVLSIFEGTEETLALKVIARNMVDQAY